MAMEIQPIEGTLTRKKMLRVAPRSSANNPADTQGQIVTSLKIKLAAVIGWLTLPASVGAQLAPMPLSLPLPGVGQVGPTLRAAGDAPLATGASVLTYGIRGNVLLSNNLDLRPDGTQTGHWLLEASPNVTYRALTSRGPLNVSAALRGQFRDGDSSAFRIRGLFSGATDLRLVDEWLNLAARGSVQTVNLDPFRASSADPGAQAGNTGSLRDFEVSPYLKGKFDGEGSWNAAYRIRSIDLSNATSVTSLYKGSNVQQSVEAGLKTDLTRRKLGLSLEGRTLRADYRNGLDYESAEADLLAWYRVSTALRLAAGWGWAYNDRLFNRSGEDQGTGAVAAIEWTPTSRSLVKARWSDRYYGNQVSASADHRYGLWNFSLAYGRGVQDGNLANFYGLLQQQLASAQASQSSTGASSTASGVVAGLESSPAAIAAATLNPALLFSGVLPSPLVYFEQASASARIQGARTAIQGAVFFNDRSSAISLGGLGGTDLNQRGLSVAGSYRFDGIQTLNLGLRYTLTDSSTSASEAKLWTLIGSWDLKLTPRWTGSAGARLQRQTGTGLTVQYDEAALFLATDYRFQ